MENLSKQKSNTELKTNKFTVGEPSKELNSEESEHLKSSCDEFGPPHPAVSDPVNAVLLSSLPDLIGSSKTPIEGRRILDIEHFASQLFCQACGVSLMLVDIIKEVRLGLSGWFVIR